MYIYYDLYGTIDNFSTFFTMAHTEVFDVSLVLPGIGIYIYGLLMEMYWSAVSSKVMGYYGVIQFRNDAI